MVPMQVMFHRELPGVSVLDCIVLDDVESGGNSYGRGEPFTMAFRHDSSVEPEHLSARFGCWAARSTVIEAFTVEVDEAAYLVLASEADHLLLEIDPRHGAI